MFKTMKLKNLFLFVAILSTVGLLAQENTISDSELTQFADAYVKLQMQNQEAQQKIADIIQDEGLELERFSEIQEAAMDPNKETDASADEIEKHANAISKIEKIQPELEKKAISDIESAGITLERYQALVSAIQQDQGLQQRLQAILTKEQGH